MAYTPTHIPSMHVHTTIVNLKLCFKKRYTSLQQFSFLSLLSGGITGTNHHTDSKDFEGSGLHSLSLRHLWTMVFDTKYPRILLQAPVSPLSLSYSTAWCAASYRNPRARFTMAPLAEACLSTFSPTTTITTHRQLGRNT